MLKNFSPKKKKNRIYLIWIQLTPESEYIIRAIKFSACLAARYNTVCNCIIFYVARLSRHVPLNVLRAGLPTGTLPCEIPKPKTWNRFRRKTVVASRQRRFRDFKWRTHLEDTGRCQHSRAVPCDISDSSILRLYEVRQ